MINDYALLTWLEPDTAHEPALIAEGALAQDWLNPEEDAAWAYLQSGTIQHDPHRT